MSLRSVPVVLPSSLSAAGLPHSEYHSLWTFLSDRTLTDGERKKESLSSWTQVTRAIRGPHGGPSLSSIQFYLKHRNPSVHQSAPLGVLGSG